MKTKSFTYIIFFLLIAVTMSISTTVFALTGDLRPVQQNTLPQITFLGEGPQTFTIEPPLMFLVKTYENGEFLFVTDDGPTYEAIEHERVWTTNFVPAESIRLFHEARSYGDVPAGCVVNFVQIEDNVDSRRNTFFINGETLHVVEQGMVTYGNFTVPEAGELTFYAEDSIGIIVELCQVIETVEPSQTPESTSTVTLLPPTVTQEATTTLTATLPPTQIIIEPSETPTFTPTVTATTPADTPTFTPTVTATTPADTSTPTQSPTVSAPTLSPSPSATAPAIFITATPIATPVTIPVTGGGPGPREIAAISIGFIGLFGLAAAAWWFLLRAINHGR